MDSNIITLNINDSHQLSINEFKNVLNQNEISIKSADSGNTKLKLQLPANNQKYVLLFTTGKQPESKMNYEVSASLEHQNTQFESKDRAYFLEDINGNINYDEVPDGVVPPDTMIYLLNQNTGDLVDKISISSDENQYLFEAVNKYDDDNQEISYAVITDPISNYDTKIEEFTITQTYQTVDISGKIKNETNQTVTLKLFDGSSNQVINTQEIPPSAVEYTFEELPQKREDSSDIDYVVSAEEIEGYTINVNGLDVIVTKDESEVEETEENTSEKTDEPEVEETEVEVDLEKDEGKINKATQESMMRSFRSARINPFGIAPLQLQSNNQYTFTKSQDIRYRRGIMANDVVGSIQGVMNESQNEITWKITLSFSGGVYNPRVYLTDFKLSDGLQVTKVSYDNKEETALSFVELGEVSPSKDLIITTRITDPSAPILRLEAGNVNTYGDNFGPLWGQFQMITEKPSVNEVTNLSTKVTGKTEPNATVIIRDSNGHQVGQTIAESDGVFSATIPNQEVGTMLTVESTAPQKLLSEKVNIEVELDPDTPLNDVVVNDFYDVETGVRGESDEGTFVTIRDVNGRVLGSSRAIMTEEGPMFYVDLHRTFPANTELIAVAHNIEGKVSNETPFIVKPTEGGQLPPNVYLERQNPYPTYDGSKGITSMEWDERGSYRNRVPQPVEYPEGYLWKYASPTETKNRYSIDLKTQGRSDVNSAPLDIVLVIDNSGSMRDSRWFGKTRWESMKEVLYPFIRELTEQNNNTRFAVVNYATDIISQSGFSNDYNSIVSSIPNQPQNPVSSSAGTFTQLGLREGAKYIGGARPEAEKVMILLTDGAPTYSYKGTAATSPEDITQFSNQRLGAGTSFNLTQLLEFQYDNYSINGIDIRNHGQATISEAKIIRNNYPEMKIFGIGLDLDLNTHYSSTSDRTRVLEQVATKPEYAFNTSNITDPEQGLRRILDTISERVSKSISKGIVTDPIGEMFDIDLGSDGVFNAEDYKLTASHPDLLNESVVPSYNSETRTISIPGLSLGSGEWVNINYNVTLRTESSSFQDNEWYPMNGLTYLVPSPDSTKKREYPVPEAKDETPNFDFKFVKTDEEGKTLEGATFILSNQENEFTATSNSDGEVIFSKLKPGNYQLRETEAPLDYLIDDTIYEVSVDKQGSIKIDDRIYDSESSFKVINKQVPKTGSITVIKHDDLDAEKTLSGAVFILKDVDGNIIDEKKTDENGQITFNDIPFGEYELIEKQSPNGYQLDDTPISVKVNEDNLEQELRIENSKSSLPNTGGFGTLIFTVMGLLLIAIAVAWRERKLS